MMENVRDLKLEIYEAEANGEITPEERDLLLEKVEEKFFMEMATISIKDGKYFLAVNTEKTHMTEFNDDDYFKFGIGKHPDKPTKIARIMFTTARYINHNNAGEISKGIRWILNDKAKNDLIDILNKKSRIIENDNRYDIYSEYLSNITVWQELIFKQNINRWSNGSIQSNTELASFYTTNKEYGKLKSKYPNALPMDLPIPDYTKLKEERK